MATEHRPQEIGVRDHVMSSSRSMSKLRMHSWSPGASIALGSLQPVNQIFFKKKKNWEKRLTNTVRVGDNGIAAAAS